MKRSTPARLWSVMSAAVLIGGALLRPSYAQTEASARQFVQEVYAGYTLDGHPRDITTTGRKAIASPELQALIKQDNKALKDEAGYLDADPLCECQDFDLKVTAIDIAMSEPQAARVNVSFLNYGSPGHVSIDLLWLNQRWYIDDVRGESDTRSLRVALKDEIKEFGTHGK